MSVNFYDSRSSSIKVTWKGIINKYLKKKKEKRRKERMLMGFHRHNWKNSVDMQSPKRSEMEFFKSSTIWEKIFSILQILYISLSFSYIQVFQTFICKMKNIEAHKNWNVWVSFFLSFYDVTLYLKFRQ